MAGHAQLKFVVRECSKTQIRLTGLICAIIIGYSTGFCKIQDFICMCLRPAANSIGRVQIISRILPNTVE